MTTAANENNPKADARKAFDKAKRARAKANRNRDIIAAAFIDGDNSIDLNLVAQAAIIAVKAERSASLARDHYLSFISA